MVPRNRTNSEKERGATNDGRRPMYVKAAWNAEKRWKECWKTSNFNVVGWTDASSSEKRRERELKCVVIIKWVPGMLYIMLQGIWYGIIGIMTMVCTWYVRRKKTKNDNTTQASSTGDDGEQRQQQCNGKPETQQQQRKPILVRTKNCNNTTLQLLYNTINSISGINSSGTTIQPTQQCALTVNPLRTAVPLWGQNTWNLIGLSPERDCGSRRVNTNNITHNYGSQQRTVKMLQVLVRGTIVNRTYSTR